MNIFVLFSGEFFKSFINDKAKDRIAQKLLSFTHDLDTKHQR